MHKTRCMFLALLMCSCMIQGCGNEPVATEPTNQSQKAETDAVDTTDLIEKVTEVTEPTNQSQNAETDSVDTTERIEAVTENTEPITEAVTENVTEAPTTLLETSPVEVETEQENSDGEPGENDTELVG